MAIKLNEPVRPNLEVLMKYLSQVNNSGWYTNFGILHQRLTERLEAYLNVENLLLVSNGTLALQVAYKTLNVKSALTTPFSYVATSSSLIWQGIEVSFSDIDKKTYNLCPEKAREALIENSDIDTIVATHVYGNPCDVGAFDNISTDRNVNVIYDAAHAFGVKIRNKSILSFGDASTLSFHATKIFHTIEGGAIIFKRKEDFQRAKRLINFGIDEKGNVSEAGINAKLNEYQCAVGLTLLDEINSITTHRESLFNLYREELNDTVDMPKWCSNASFNGSYMPISLKNISDRILVEEILKDHEIQFRHYFSPSLDKAFRNVFVSSSSNSNELVGKVLCLPLHFYMSIDNVLTITNLIKKVLK